MKILKEYWLYILLIFLSVVSILYGLVSPASPPKIGFANNIYSEDSLCMSQVRFSKKIIDFDTVPDDTVLKAKFMLYNVGSHPLKIKSVNPDCTCTDYFLSKDSVNSGDSILLMLIYNTKNKLGEQELYTILKMNTPEKMYKLTLKAYVEFESSFRKK